MARALGKGKLVVSEMTIRDLKKAGRQGVPLFLASIVFKLK